jgi:hypothetical protein
MGSAERGETAQGEGGEQIIDFILSCLSIFCYAVSVRTETPRGFSVFLVSFPFVFSRWRGFYDPGIISLISFISAGWVSSDTFATDETLGLGSLDGAGNPTERLELDLAYFCY